MKLETLAVLTKGACKLISGTLAPIGTGLVVMAQSKEPFHSISGAALIIGGLVGGVNNLDAWLSSSYHDYEQQKKADTTGNTLEIKHTEVKKENIP